MKNYYVRSQQKWQSSFIFFEQSIDAYKSQTSSWLNIIDIAAFIRRLNLTKKKIFKLIRLKENDI